MSSTVVTEACFRAELYRTHSQDSLVFAEEELACDAPSRESPYGVDSDHSDNKPHFTV